MRKLFTIIIYTLIILLIGRNIPSLPRFNVFSDPKNYPQELKNEIQKLIKNKKGNYGIFFADINSNKTLGINEKEIFTAASVNKLYIVAVLYNLAWENKIDLQEQITLQKSDIQDYGTGSLRYQKIGSTYTLKTLAKLALKQSDNTAAYILSQKIGQNTIQQYINNWGLTQTSMENNETSPSDLYKLFQMLNQGKIIPKGKVEEILSFMYQTDIEDRIPALLPSSAKAYHKTGDAIGYLHDVGFIDYDNKRYFLAVLTSDIGNQETVTKETIAQIARTIIEFYNKRK